MWGKRIYGGLANFQDPGGWPMFDNDIFQGGQMTLEFLKELRQHTSF